MPHLDALDLEPDARRRALDARSRYIATRCHLASIQRRLVSLQQDVWDHQAVMRGSLAAINRVLVSAGLDLDERIDLAGELFAVGELDARHLGNTPEDDDDYDLASEREQDRIDLARAQFAGR